MKNLFTAIGVWVVLILLTPLPLHANTYTGQLNRHVASTPELNRSHVSNLQQDSNGFIWAATWNGLVRYDGYTAHTFKPIQSSDGTIDSDRIYNIKMTAAGDIWCVSSDNRLFIFSPHSFTFQNLSSSIPELHGRKVKVLTPLKNGHTWVRLHDGGCLRLTDAGPADSVTIYNRAGDIVNGARSITGISLDDAGDEWILTDKGALNHTQKKLISGQYRYVESLHGSTYLIDGNGSVTRASDGHTFHSTLPEGCKVRYVRTNGHRIVLATDGGIISIDTRDGNTLHHSRDAATYIYKDSHLRIWGFGPRDGVVMIPDINATASVKLAAATQSGHQPIKNPQLIFETPGGEIILRPTGGALCMYDEEARRLTEIQFDGMAEDHYSPTNIKKHIIDSHGNLWVLHGDGTDCISFSRRTFTHLRDRHQSETRAMTVDRRGHLWRGLRPGLTTGDGFSLATAAPAYVIKESPDGKIWVGTKGDGIYVIDPDYSHRVTHLSRAGSDGHSLHSDSIYDIVFEGDRIWLGSYGNGLACGTAVSGGWRFGKVPGQPRDMKIRSILPDGNGNLLIATADGLVTTDAGRNARPTFHTNRFRSDGHGLKGNDIMSILKCDGTYYACVFGSGISRIDSDNFISDSLKFTTFTLPATSEAGQMRTAVAAGGDIWVAAGGTLTRFNPHSQSMTVMPCDTPTDRISFSEAAPAVDADGNIIFGTTDGIIVADPRLMPGNDNGNRMKVTGILYQNDMSVHPLNNPPLIRLTPGRRSFTLLLSDMSYSHGGIGHVRYKLDGLESGWNYPLGNQPAITYNNLPPGNYKLIIQSEAPDGTWQDSSDGTFLEAVPTFTETIWFRLLIVILLTALFIGLTVAIIHYKRLRNALQRKYSLLMTIGRVSDRLDAEAAGRKQPAPTPKEDDRLFIETSFKFLNDNIDNPDLMVDDFARHLKMSRTAYYNRMKEVAGVSPVDFIRQTRIKRALKHLESNKYTISEVAYMVGFSDPKYFSRCFKAEMAMTPSQYRESLTDSKLPD